LLVDLYAAPEPSGWRLADHAGRETRRARGWLSADLDAAEEAGQGYRGAFKVQLTGPWTLAAALQLRTGQPALADPGAVRDLAASLAEGAVAHLADVTRRLPEARPVLQLDEPALPAVLAGGVPTASGLGRVPAVDRAVVRDVLRGLTNQATRGQTTGADVPVLVHCCAPSVPVRLLREAGAAAVALDVGQLPTGAAAAALDEEFGEAFESGARLVAGVYPTGPGAPGAASDALSALAGSVGRVRALWRRIGLPWAALPGAVLLSPACGLASAAPSEARDALRRCARAAAELREDPEGEG
jgi:methionine synthase II (cobalamin-independent)